MGAPRFLRLAVPLALALAPAAQERPALGRTGADYFPLRAGSTWTYQRTDATGARSAVEVTCRGTAAAGRVTAFELAARSAEGGRYEYWRTDETGVWRCPGTGDERLPGLSGRPPARWLACPPGLETRWSWEDRAAAQRLRLDPHDAVPCRAEVLDMSARLEVPAGEYTAICVRIDAQPDPGAPGTRHVVWFAARVGPVRRETFALEGTAAVLVERDELVAFAPGPAEPPEPLAVAAAFVAAHRGLWPAGAGPELALIELPPGPSAMPTRFVRVLAAAGPGLLRVTGAAACPFDSSASADVGAWFAADSLDAAAGLAPQHHELHQFARTWFALRAALDGAPVAGTTVQQSSSSRGPGAAGTSVRGTFVSGRGETLELAFLDSKLERLAYRAR